MGRYPTPDEAERRFVEGVEASRDVWALRTRAGSTKYRLWYVGFAREIYPLVARLPPRTGSARENTVNRAAVVAEAIQNLSRAYREQKVSELTRALPPVAAR